MKLGVSALLFNLDEAIEICRKFDKINHIELGLDNLDECFKLYKYKDEFEKLNLSLGIHLPMEVNSCDNIKYIRNSWIDFIDTMNFKLKDFNIQYFNMHLGYVISDRLYKNREKYLDNSVLFFEKLLKLSNIIVAIENTYTNGGDFSNIGYIHDDFKYIFNKVKNKRLCFCYDTGHNLINKSDYISNLNDRLEIIHLSDNNGRDDSHLGIGRGILHENEIKSLFNLNAKYLILEINHNHIKETVDILDKIKKGVWYTPFSYIERREYILWAI